MPEQFTITVNGRQVAADDETSVAVAILRVDDFIRISVSGEPRGPLCAIGVCFECRATVNGIEHQRTCQMLCEPGMDVRHQ